MKRLSGRQSGICAIVAVAAFALTGCGGGSSTPSQPLTITGQPLSQTVPLGSTATFQVSASGSGTLSYQWSENGVPISGATAASYTTPDVALGPDGSTQVGTFQVTVSNASGSITSKGAVLTAGPRSPKQGDLRYLQFQQVDSPGLGDFSGEGTIVGPSNGFSAQNALGSPLSLGSSLDCASGCGWAVFTTNLPFGMTALSVYYEGQPYTNYAAFQTSLQSLSGSSIVFTSLDLEPPSGAYGIAWVQVAANGGFDYRLDPRIPPGAGQAAQIQAQATLDGSQSREITAVSFDESGNAVLVSYGWTGDTTTVYEAQTAFIPPGMNILTDTTSAAKTLAGEGYSISAFGGNDKDGYILVGMRVQGDTLPRTLFIDAAVPTSPPYATPVIQLVEPGQTNPPYPNVTASIAEQ